MKRPERFLARTRFGVRAFVVLTAVLLFAIITVTAFTQKSAPAGGPEAAVGVEEFKDGCIKEAPGATDQKSISPNAITASIYPFTSSTGALLEDMSSGTTTMIAPNMKGIGTVTRKTITSIFIASTPIQNASGGS